jgi:hypothetical protein
MSELLSRFFLNKSTNGTAQPLYAGSREILCVCKHRMNAIGEHRVKPVNERQLHRQLADPFVSWFP